MKAALVAPIALWGAYVIIANLLLGTGLVAKLASARPEDATLVCASAWSLWPFVVHLRGFRISGSDTTLQWDVELDEARADIHLSDLLERRFRADHVRARGLVFRMRLLVDPTSDRDLGAPHILELPPIPERTSPPIKPESPPRADLVHSDAGYDLWTVHLEDIDTTIKEIWIQQARYLGEGRAQGSFYYKPLREVRVGPAALELRSGELRVGERVLARLDADVDVTMPSFDPRRIDGPNLFEVTSMSARVRLDAILPQLDGLDLPLGQGLTAELGDGSGALKAELTIDPGSQTPFGFVSYATRRIDLRTPRLSASAGGEIDLRIDAGGSARARVSVPRATLDRRGERRPGKRLPPVVVEGARATLAASPLKLADLPPRIRWEEMAATAAIPDLRWLNPESAAPDGPRFTGGAAFLGGEIELGRRGTGAGALRARVKRGAMQWAGASAIGDGTAEITLEGVDVTTRTAIVPRGRIDVRDLAIQRGSASWAGFWAQVDVDRAELANRRAEAALRLRSKDARPLVGLLDAAGAIPGWATGLLAMDGLRASATVTQRDGDLDVRLLRAEGGNVVVRGRLSRAPGRPPRGAFLVKSGLLSVGIDISENGTGLRPFAGDRWMDERMAGGAPHGPGAAKVAVPAAR